MRNIDCLIFSYNRPMQLELCIRSLREKMPFVNNIHVLYRVGSANFNEGYYKTLNLHSVCHEIEINFEQDVKRIIKNKINSNYIFCLCDDDVFINAISKEEYDLLISEYREDVSCISMRMNPTTNFCYPALAKDQNMIIPDFIERDRFLKWDWTKCNPASDWGYPHCINQHIYKVDDFIKLIDMLSFTFPNALEGEMNHNRDNTNPYMVSFKQSKLFNIMNSFVKPGGGIVYKDYSPERLNEIFMAGKYISTENIYGMQKQQCHGQVDFIFEDF